VSAKHPTPPGRSESREIVELRRLKERQPELSSAADLQIALLDLQRRVQQRVPLPWVQVDETWWKSQQSAGRPLLRFDDLPLNWTDFRLMFRETAAILKRHDALDADDFETVQTLAREGDALEPTVRRWYAATTGGPASAATETSDPPIPDMVQQVLLLATRPFLGRCAEVLMPKLDLSEWWEGICPLCGGEPEMAVITQAADRMLICGRCTARWRYAPLACPFCRNGNKDRITSFASRDGMYRIYACEECRRYIKAYDGRRAGRPVLPPVDSVATLPLDAAAMQRGYTA
jgi:hypothetical protein